MAMSSQDTCLLLILMLMRPATTYTYRQGCHKSGWELGGPPFLVSSFVHMLNFVFFRGVVSFILVTGV